MKKRPGGGGGEGRIFLHCRFRVDEALQYSLPSILTGIFCFPDFGPATNCQPHYLAQPKGHEIKV